MVDQAGGFQAAQVFGEQPGHEQRIVADVAMDLTFAIEGLGLQEHLRFKQHVDDGVCRTALSVTDLVELIGVGEFDEEIGHVLGDIEIRPPEMFGEALFGQRPEQLTEWMAARNRTSHHDLPGNPCPLTPV